MTDQQALLRKAIKRLEHFHQTTTILYGEFKDVTNVLDMLRMLDMPEFDGTQATSIQRRERKRAARKVINEGEQHENQDR